MNLEFYKINFEEKENDQLKGSVVINMASDLYQFYENGSIKFYDFLAVLSRTQNETHRFFIFLNLYFLIVLFDYLKNLSIL